MDLSLVILALVLSCCPGKACQWKFQVRVTFEVSSSPAEQNLNNKKTIHANTTQTKIKNNCCIIARPRSTPDRQKNERVY